MPKTVRKCFCALIAVLVLLAGVVFTGCDGTSSGGDGYSASDQQPVRGWVFVRDALTGASLVIYDLTGNPPFSGKPREQR